MRALGFDVKKADIVKMVHDVDPNNSGSVDYPQFLEISMSISLHFLFGLISFSLVLFCFFATVTERYSERNPEEEILKAFQVQTILLLSLSSLFAILIMKQTSFLMMIILDVSV